MKKFLSTIVLAIVCLFLASCANYRLAGTPVELPFKSVYVAPAKNLSYAPQASAPLTNAIIRAINQVPDLRTAAEGDAQAILETNIVEYERIPLASSSVDTALAASYNMRVTAECTLKRANGDVIFQKRKVRAETIVYANGVTEVGGAPRNDVIGNEYQNMPILMRELGGKIKDAVIGIW